MEEVHEKVPLSVQGQLPWFLEGCLYRIGPGIFDIRHADGQYAEKTHWFDGIGVVFKLDIDATRNSVSFMCRSTCPEAIRAIKSTPKSDYKDLSFGASKVPHKSPLDALRHITQPLTKDPQTGRIPMNVNVTLETIPGQGALVARSDFAYNLQLDPETLEVTRIFDFSELDPRLTGVASAAHSAVDERTGELFNFAAGDWRNPGRYRVFCINANGETDVIAEVQANPSCHVHSLALTEHFVILAVAPWRVDAAKLLVNSALEPSLGFDYSKKTEFFIISRAQRRVVATYETEPFASFHYVNAFEDPSEDTLHIDVCRYDRADILEQFYLRNLRTRPADWFTPVRPVRYSLPGVRAAARRRRAPRRCPAHAKVLSNDRLELPCVAPCVEGRAYRYTYGVSHDASHDGILTNALVKLDVRSGVARSWSSPRCCVGEPTFVPDPTGTQEDDGVLLTFIVDAARRRSAMIVLDARSMTEICRAETPHIVPHAFHGMYADKRAGIQC